MDTLQELSTPIIIFTSDLSSSHSYKETLKPVSKHKKNQLLTKPVLILTTDWKL